MLPLSRELLNHDALVNVRDSRVPVQARLNKLTAARYLRASSRGVDADANKDRENATHDKAQKMLNLPRSVGNSAGTA
jgi:topoisomerase IA-like protein